MTIEKTTAASMEKTAARRSLGERVDSDRFKKVKPREHNRQEPAARK